MNVNTTPYKHPYGGMAKDIFVNRTRFAETFGMSVESLNNLPIDMKVGDVVKDGKEICGYIYKSNRRSGRKFVLTIIDLVGWPSN